MLFLMVILFSLMKYLLVSNIIFHWNLISFDKDSIITEKMLSVKKKYIGYRAKLYNFNSREFKFKLLLHQK